MNWLNGLKNRICGVRRMARRRVVSAIQMQGCGSETLEVRSLMAADFTASLLQTVQSEVDSEIDAQQAAFDAMVREVSSKVNQFADKLDKITEAVKDIPVTGDEIAAKLNTIVNNALKLDVPQNEVRGYLEARGFKVDSIASTQDLLNGTAKDLIVLTYVGMTTTDSPFVVSAEGQFGKSNGIHFGLTGQISATPKIGFNLTFGLDGNGDFFVQEGSVVGARVTVDGSLDGRAVIPNLTDVTVHASAPAGKHLVDASVDVIFSDFDAIEDERLYLTGEKSVSVSDLLGHDDAITLSGTADLNAELSVASPLGALPDFMRDALSGLLPESLTWSADVDYDFVTGEASYDIDTSSIEQLVEVLSSDSIENAVFNVLVDQISEHNPIPESVQTLLSKKLPVIGRNLMDLLDVPQAAQFLITPEAFRNKPVDEVQTEQEHDKLDFNFDLFSPSNIQKLLSGETFDIVSVDIEQRFEKALTPITVLPETTLFSYCGIVNVTAQINLLLDMHFGFDMTLGFDSKGFYALGATRGEDGQLLDDGEGNRPNIEFGGGITGQIIAEGDLCVVIDFVRITAEVGIEAFGGFTFVSPNADSAKLRADQLFNADNIEVSAGIDLNLGLKGELGLLDLGLKAEVAEQQTIELYRHSGGTLSDLQAKLANFKDQLQEEADGLAFNMVEHAVEQAINDVNKWVEDSNRKVKDWLATEAAEINGFIKSRTDAVEQWTRQQLTNLETWASKRIDDINKATNAQIDGLNKLLDSQIGNINKLFDNTIGRLNSKMSGPVRDLINRATSEVRSAVDTVRKTVTSVIKGAQRQIGDWAKNANGQVLSIVKKAQGQIFAQVEAASDKITETALAEVNRLIDAQTALMTKAVEQQSAAMLKVIGTSDELQQKIQEASLDSARTSADVTKEVLNELRDALSSAKAQAQDVIDRQVDAVKKATEDGLQKVEDQVNRQLDSAKDAASKALDQVRSSANQVVDQVSRQATELVNNIKDQVTRAASEFKNKAEGVAKNALDQVARIEREIREAAERAAKAAREAAEKAAKAAREAAERAAKAAREAAAKAAALKAQQAREAAAKAAAAAKSVAKKLRW